MKSAYILVQLLGFALLFFIFPLGFILGIILIVVGGKAYRDESLKVPCPVCKENIMKGAQKCRYCGEKLSAQTPKGEPL